MKQCTNPSTEEVYRVCEKTCSYNLKNIMNKLSNGYWHWLLPDSWVTSDQNKLLVYKVAQIVLHQRNCDYSANSIRIAK